MAATPKHFVPIVATVFVLLFLWLSSVPILSWYEQSAAHQQLDDASFRWHHQRIVNYSFEFDTLEPVGAGIRPPLRIEVRGGEFLAAHEVDSGRLADIAGVAAVPSSVDAAFAMVAGILEQRPHSIDVRYDPSYGFPTRIEVRHDAGDDPETWHLRAFRETD